MKEQNPKKNKKKYFYPQNQPQRKPQHLHENIAYRRTGANRYTKRRKLQLYRLLDFA